MSTAQHQIKFESKNVLSNVSGKLLADGHSLFVFERRAQQEIQTLVKNLVPAWQQEELSKEDMHSFRWTSAKGPIFLLRARPSDRSWENSSDFGRARDLVGAWARENMFSHKEINIRFYGVSKNFIKGALHGLGLASLETQLKTRALPKISVSLKAKPLSKDLVTEALHWSNNQNLARFLVNRPAAEVNPESLSKFSKQNFKGNALVKVKVLGPKELKDQGYGLISGVGQGATIGAHLVHLSYRPAGAKGRPIALVGKGVTFDTGGLDIKPASNMRLMKKDMAGAAAVLGLFKMAVDLKLKVSVDAYLALAENSVSDRAMRPGDILIAKNGLQVEIDNTDAEGRLVMADAFCLALSAKSKDAPAVLIDVSTLTGAMRVALGLDVAGYFSNHEGSTAKVNEASARIGELAWQMPLVKKYFKTLRSSVADMTNSSTDGFGGAITAALFLEKFVDSTPWVHFDVMSWARSPEGAFGEGGNGQCFQIIAQWLTGWAEKEKAN